MFFASSLFLISVVFFENKLVASALNPVPLGKYPYVVQLVREDPNSQSTFNCTGTIIHPRYVLTALFCIIADDSLASVNDTHIIYDTNRPHISSSQNKVDVERFYFPVPLENFTIGNEEFVAKNNIAIIQVAFDLPINNNVNSTVLTGREMPFNKNLNAIVVGFGGIGRDGEKNQLREYSGNVEDLSPEIIPISLQNTNIRVGEIGSPLLIEEDGILKQYGIASNNHEQSNGKITPIFGRIGHHCEWIHKVTKELVKCE